jgi:hypothetical protein
MRWRSAIVTAGLAMLVGCAHRTPAVRPHVVVEPPPPPKGIRLAVLPVESDGFPELAEWVSSLLADVRVAGVDEYFKPRVALEVVQLSIECVDPTPACYTQVGKSLRANKLLMAVITGGSGHHRKRPVKLRIILFDVDQQREIRATERQFKNQDQALADAEDLVNATLGDRVQAAAGGGGAHR